MINAKDVNEFEWDFGDGTTLKNISPVKHTYHKILDTTFAKVILKSIEGCAIAVDIPFIVEGVKAGFIQLDTAVFCPGHVYLRNITPEPGEFQWITPEGKLIEGGDTAFIVYPEPGDYNVTLIAVNRLNNCKDTITKSIHIEEIQRKFVFPNVFTPNGDGENDYFRPVIQDFKDDLQYEFVTFKVFDRWGNIVYENQNPAEGWDGTYKGKKAPAGVYGYYFEVILNGCEKTTKKGNVLLMR